MINRNSGTCQVKIDYYPSLPDLEGSAMMSPLLWQRGREWREEGWEGLVTRLAKALFGLRFRFPKPSGSELGRMQGECGKLHIYTTPCTSANINDDYLLVLKDGGAFVSVYFTRRIRKT